MVDLCPPIKDCDNVRRPASHGTKYYLTFIHDPVPLDAHGMSYGGHNYFTAGPYMITNASHMAIIHHHRHAQDTRQSNYCFIV